MRNLLMGTVMAGAMLASGPLAAQAVKFVTQGVTDNEIVLGTHTDLSGPIAAIGADGRDGLLMLVDEVNAAGGVNGRKIKLIVEDTGYDTKRAVLAGQKLVERDKVFAIVFPFGTPTSLATLPIAKEKGIPHLFPGSSGMAFHTPPHPLSYGYFLPERFFMKLGVDYAAREIKPKRVGAIYQGDDYGEAMLAGAKEALARHKIELVEALSYKPGATEFSSHVSRLKAANVDLILLGTALRELVAVARERQKLGWDVKLMGGFPAYNAIALLIGKDAMEGVYGVGQNKIYYVDTAPPQVKGWYERFRARFNRDPGPTAIASWNALSMTLEGIRQAGRNLTVESFEQGMYKVRYKDIFDTPETTFTPQRHLPPAAGFIAQVRKQRWEILTPWMTE